MAKRLWYRKKAIALLEKWSTEATPIEFIDQSSGLRHPGVVHSLSRTEGFLFVAGSGARTLIFPRIWDSVTVERDITTSGPGSIHIGEGKRDYSLVLDDT